MLTLTRCEIDTNRTAWLSSDRPRRRHGRPSNRIAALVSEMRPVDAPVLRRRHRRATPTFTFVPVRRS